MADIKTFKRPKKTLPPSSNPRMARSALMIIFLLLAIVSLLPFALVSFVFYWTFSKVSKGKFMSMLYTANFNLEEIVKDAENGNA